MTNPDTTERHHRQLTPAKVRMLADIEEEIVPPEVKDRPAPVTRFGLANKASVLPGQSRTDLAAFIAAWMRDNNRKSDAAFRCYAGMLSTTKPNETDFVDRETAQVAYAAWLSSCTPEQMKILNLASRKAREGKREKDRKEYAEVKLAEKGEPVREYLKDRSEEGKRALAAARQKSHREKLKLQKAEAQKAMSADLDDLMIGLDLGDGPQV